MMRRVLTVSFLLLVGVPLAGSAGYENLGQHQAGGRFTGTLAVLTYNVKGLPWPVAWGRSYALAAIGDRLRTMRRTGHQPAVVVLQEAFTKDARRIAATAGYRYVVEGPEAGDLAPAATADKELTRFAADASWLAGEREGHVVNSGLRILSDYPIVSVRLTPFPALACAGYDCLANKGAVMATIMPPGAPSAIEVVATHLNSRRSSGVSDGRSLFAYRRQLKALTAFIRANHDNALPLIVAGDFNAGRSAGRRQALRSAVQDWASRCGEIADALGIVRAQAGLPTDAEWTWQRARDRQFFASGTRAIIHAAAVDVPFGRDPTGTMLSDHVGWTATYRLRPSKPDATTNVRSTP